MAGTHGSIIQKVGHGEIDRQHEELERLIGELDGFCPDNTGDGGNFSQSQGSPIDECRKQLTTLLRQLLKFVAQHFRYEEELMRQLPDIGECRDHVRRHKLAHAELSARVVHFTERLSTARPDELAAEIRMTLTAWTGSHTEGLDRRMVELQDNAVGAEFDEDSELALLLARHRAPKPC